MPPPTVIRICIFIKSEVTSVRAVYTVKSTLGISLCILIYKFLVKPLVKRTTMVKHSVKYDPYALLMCYIYKVCKKSVTCFKIFLIGCSYNILGRFKVIFRFRIYQFSSVIYYLCIMRIYMLIILSIVLMI